MMSAGGDRRERVVLDKGPDNLRKTGKTVQLERTPSAPIGFVGIE